MYAVRARLRGAIYTASANRPCSLLTFNVYGEVTWVSGGGPHLGLGGVAGKPGGGLGDVGGVGLDWEGGEGLGDLGDEGGLDLGGGVGVGGGLGSRAPDGVQSLLLIPLSCAAILCPAKHSVSQYLTRSWTTSALM